MEAHGDTCLLEMPSYGVPVWLPLAAGWWRQKPRLTVTAKRPLSGGYTLARPGQGKECNGHSGAGWATRPKSNTSLGMSPEDLVDLCPSKPMALETGIPYLNPVSTSEEMCDTE